MAGSNNQIRSAQGRRQKIDLKDIPHIEDPDIFRVYLAIDSQNYRTDIKIGNSTIKRW